MAYDALATYLNDHLGGAAAALQLLEHMSARETGENRSFYAGLLQDVTADRETLEAIIHRVGTPSTIREVGGWLAEKAHRLKMLWDDPASDQFHEFEALELLHIGIFGKRSLWRALNRVCAGIPALQNVDFKRLEQRADEQLARVEVRRLASAERALAGGAATV